MRWVSFQSLLLKLNKEMFHPQTTVYLCFSALFFLFLWCLAVATQENRDVKKANNTYKDLKGVPAM